MGNNTSSSGNNNPPYTEKKIFDYSSNTLQIGLSEMQGWRNKMEDASLIHISKIHKNTNKELKIQINDSSFENNENEKDELHSSSSENENEDENTKEEKTILNSNTNIIIKEYLDKISLFGVFDGHGGEYVAKFVADNFFSVFKHAYCQKYVNEGLNDHTNNIKETNFKLIRRISNCSTYIEKVEQALIQTFLDFDELLYTSLFSNMVNEYRTAKIRNFKIRNFNSSILNSSELLESDEDSPAYMMGTTANVISIYNNYLIIANSGDSLSVLYSKGKAIILNTEHKVSVQGEEKRILQSGFKIYNGRVDGKLNLTRAIGDLQFKDKKLRPYEQAVTSYPEVLSYELTKDTEFLVSGCDGIWDCVEPQKFCEFISGEMKKGEKLSAIIGNIQDMILSKTINSPIGTDNMTCYIVKFNIKHDKDN